MGQVQTKFNLVEVKASENNKDFFVEGFISTTDPDLYNDIVTEEAQKRIQRQLLNRDITMDDEHEVWIDPDTGVPHDRPQDLIPAAKVVDAQLREMEDGTVGTWVRVMLNKDYPLFEKVLGSIKNGFLHSFSIAYNVLKKVDKRIGEQVFRIIDDLHIFNVGMTGSPVNSNAQFELALKSINKKMVEQTKTEGAEAPTMEAVVAENVQLKADLEASKAEVKGLQSAGTKSEEKVAETKSLVDAKDAEMVEIKSLYDGKFAKLEKDFAEMKAVVEKVRSTPIPGAQLKAQEVAETKAVTQEVSFTSLMQRGIKQ